jgi:hypothetical protein
MIERDTLIELDGSQNSRISGNDFNGNFHLQMDYSKGGSPEKTILKMRKNTAIVDFVIDENTFGLVVIIECKLCQMSGPKNIPLLIDQESYDYLMSHRGIDGFKDIVVNSQMAQDIYFCYNQKQRP